MNNDESFRAFQQQLKEADKPLTYVPRPHKCGACRIQLRLMCEGISIEGANGEFYICDKCKSTYYVSHNPDDKYYMYPCLIAQNKFL